jgi:hypothetical protein
MRRVLWITLGAVAAVVAVRQLRRLAGRSTSAEASGGLGERLGDFLARVQEAAAEREVELRAALGLDGRYDVVDVHPVDKQTGVVHTADNGSAGPGSVEDNE